MDILNERIRQRKNEIGITARQLGEAMNLSIRAVQGWTGGITTPRAGDIPRLCNVLQCTPNYLFGWEDEACSR